MLIVQNYANNFRSVSRITRRSHLYSQRRLVSKWLTTAVNDTQDMGIGYSSFLCVCVILIRDWTNGLKWQLAATRCYHTDQSQGSILFMPELGMSGPVIGQSESGHRTGIICMILDSQHSSGGFLLGT